MDIAAASVALNQGQVQQQASLMVMRKVMDTAEQNGQALTDMLAATPAPRISPAHLGQQVDISV